MVSKCQKATSHIMVRAVMCGIPGVTEHGMQQKQVGERGRSCLLS